MRAKALVASAVAVGVAGVGAVGWVEAQSADAGVLEYRDPAVVMAGAEIYAAHCADCHGTDLEGQANWRERDADGYLPAPPHDETGHTWHHPDEVLVAITTHGTAALVGGDYQTNMMGFADVLEEAQIVAVLSYIKSTWPVDVIEVHDGINAQAATQ